ncbi:MAG: peptidoglycan recognition family protein, partial [Candidatus Saccharimonadales bacterium]
MKYGESITRSVRTGIIVMMALVVSVVAPAQVLAATATNNQANNRQQQFQSAAQEFGVPADVLMAISYNQSRWENHDGKPSVGGGYGLMHLTAPTIIDEDARGDVSRPLAPRTQAARGENTLAMAASLIGQNADVVKTNDAQNVRGAAALLAKYAKEANDGKVPASAGDLYGAVVRVSGISDATQAQEFADSVYSTMQKGAALTTTDGQNLQLPAQNVQPNKGQASTLATPDVLKKQPSNPNAAEAECPRTITCKFVPARYAQNNPANPADYGNMDVTNRPKDAKINYIVIHDTEGSYQSAIDWFQDPTSYVAGHYVIRSSDGEVTQMVKNKDIGWHAGNWYMNMHSIGVEHEGYAADGSWYTETMYRTSAKLVRYLAGTYNIPLDRQHIVGHDQFHGLTPARAKQMHHDPGPFWDWDYYMELLQGRD